MIHYMPFTYISEGLLESLSVSLGPFTVVQPLASGVPVHISTAARKGLLRLRCPACLNQSELKHTLREFNAWSAVHQYRRGDLTAFLACAKSQEVQMNDRAHRLRSLILAEQAPAPAPPSPLLPSALFLCMAQEYDRQQAELLGDLHSVGTLERRFAALLGEQERGSVALGPELEGSQAAAADDPGRYMTQQRVAAWACLAGAGPPAEHAFVTTSRAVWEYLRGRLPDAEPMLVDQPVAGAGPLRALIEALGRAAGPLQIPAGLQAAGSKRPLAQLTLHMLTGCTPLEMLERLKPALSESVPGRQNDPAASNSLIGLLQVPGPSAGLAC